jgi:hypothetical protein
MIFDEINSIVSEIEKAKDIQESILLLSQEPDTVDKASRLSDVISKLQANVVSIQSEYIQLLKVKTNLEKKS